MQKLVFSTQGQATGWSTNNNEQGLTCGHKDVRFFRLKTRKFANKISIVYKMAFAFLSTHPSIAAHLYCGNVVESCPKRVKDTEDSFKQFYWVGDACSHESC